MTNGNVWKAADSPHVLYEDYAHFKCEYKDTKQLCEAQNLVFTPIIFESHGGGWSPDSLRIFDNIAKQQTSTGFRCREGNSIRIAQRLSTAIRMANLRAILKHLPAQVMGGHIFYFDVADEIVEAFTYQ